MSKKMILIGDLHFGSKCTVDQFVEYQERELDRAVSHAVKNEIKFVVLMGDVFDDRKNVYIKTLELLRRKFREYAETGIEFIIIVGNHDTFYKNTNSLNTPSEVFDGLDRNQFHIIDKTPMTMTIGGQTCLFMPWMAKDVHAKMVNHIETSPADYCFGHFEINGFVMNNSNKCRSSLKASSFRGFKQTFSGHFHTKSREKNILYVGSLSQLDWSDHGVDKGFHVLDLETGAVEHVESEEEMFTKIIIGRDFSFDSVSGIKDRFLKVYVNRKLSTKENSQLGELVTRNVSYEVIDNTILGDVEVDDAVVESEDFHEIVDACIDIQEISDADKKAVALLITEYHEKMLQERKQ